MEEKRYIVKTRPSLNEGGCRTATLDPLLQVMLERFLKFYIVVIEQDAHISKDVSRHHRVARCQIFGKPAAEHLLLFTFRLLMLINMY